MGYLRSTDKFSPLYFLASLGAGGLAITFFMYLMWMTPHQGQPIPSFDTLVPAFVGGSIAMKAIITVGVLGIASFAFLHVRILAWAFRHYGRWKSTPAFEQLRKSNAENQLMALPLTLAMSLNLSFIVGAVFVPGLWGIVEYLFPLAMLGFGALGVWALRIFGEFLGRVLTKDGFNCSKNNSLGQMLSVFSLAMIGVGFSASAAMSHNPVVSAIALLASAFFIMATLIFGGIFLVLGFRSMMEHVAAKETSPTLWIIIPILTVVGIAMFRWNKAFDHNFGVEWASGEIFGFLMVVFAVQLVFGYVGWVVMKRFGYFEHYVSGPGKSVGSYALVCPGVALIVFSNFVINPGLVGMGVFAKFSLPYFLAYVPLVGLQFLTIRTFFRLNRKLLKPSAPEPQSQLVPAE